MLSLPSEMSNVMAYQCQMSNVMAYKCQMSNVMAMAYQCQMSNVKFKCHDNGISMSNVQCQIQMSWQWHINVKCQGISISNIKCHGISMSNVKCHGNGVSMSNVIY